jgi:hypothetical protein
MRYLWLALLVLPVATCADNPVIVELFTSEGCSSCPTAETLLANLERRQPVGGVQVIALEEHVDYWNQLGWKDAYSSPQFRFRQNDYAKLFGVDDVYTPQMVVAGQAGFSGNDRDAALAEISKYGSAPQEDLELSTSPNTANPALLDLHVAIQSHGLTPGGGLVYLAVTESGIASYVAGGENKGRNLRHAPVVRSFGVIGKMEPRNPALKVSSTLQLPIDWKRENLRAVVFLQDKKSKKITGARAIDLN